MKFRMKADVTFEADNIDHAFDVIILHFVHILEPDRELDPLLIGEIEIKPEE